MKSRPRALSPTLLRILLHSGFGAKCGAPHFGPLLSNTLFTELNMPRERDEVRTPRVCVALVGPHWGISIGEPIGSVSPPDSTAPETARGQTNISSKNARIAAHERAAAFAS